MASSSLSSSSARSSYQVFLSFRGDTQKTFTDHLYTKLCDIGINTFRDDEEIRKGEDISVELLKAIEESMISIIVFSKTYAQSRWCLNELVKILECKQKLGQKILPIFYDVDPSEIRKQTGGFGDALDRHRKRFGDRQVNEWKAALTTVADLSGWDLQTMANGYESKFIKNITKWVQSQLKDTHMYVAKYPVGIESRATYIDNLLQSQTNDDVKMVGMFGMGGVGKTTLAKAIYNKNYQRFEGSCFIADIRSEVSGGRHNLVRLQEKLLCETLKKNEFQIGNVDRGISLINERLQSKKILIVLDDIDDKSQLESLAGQRDWFGSGSIIIITTRDVHLLNDLGAHEKYKVTTLSSNESLQLLSWHAFGVPEPLEDYVELSKRIASYTGGLPLALEVIGSRLRGISVQGWSNDAEKLRKMPNTNVQEILKISYDALDDDTQNIFLDIASFFIGHDKDNVATILKACDFCAGSGIRTLVERCLLTVNVFGKLEMHDLVQDMGREVVRKENPQEPGKRSRLVDPKDVFDVLQGDKGTEAIQGMIVNSNTLRNESFKTKVFRKMVNLRILILDGVCLKGSFKYLSNKLRLFKLHNFRLNRIPSDHHFGKLVELNLRRSNIEEFQSSMQDFRCLRILKLGFCEQLKKTPDFTGAQCLETVSFENCSNLGKVHPSIGCLERLVELDFRFCMKIKELPSSICNLKSLEVLNLYGCEKLKELPIDLGKLEQLRKLFANRTAISHLPFSLGCLRNLELLYLGDQKSLLPTQSKPKSQLHDILSPHLWTTRSHHHHHDPVHFFPPSVVNLCSLEALSIPSINLHEGDLSTAALGSLTSLIYLDLSGNCSLQYLPFNLCHLSNLDVLKLDNLQNLIELPELPPSLGEFSAENCVSLKKIADISNLRTLQRLYIRNCKSLVELPGLESLESLEELEMQGCNALTLPIALESSSSQTNLDLSGSCYLESLPFRLCHLSDLKKLCLDNLRHLRALQELPASLEMLSARNCGSLKRVADISNLRRLQILHIGNCKSLVELPGLESLESLQSVEMSNCSTLSIPLTRNWFQVHSKGNTVQIGIRVVMGFKSVFCIIPKLVRRKSLAIINRGFDRNHFNGVRVAVQSKTSGEWIMKEEEYIKIKKFERINFEVPARIEEVLEVYADFHPQQILCLLEIHRNRDGEVHLFPSTRGFLQDHEI